MIDAYHLYLNSSEAIVRRQIGWGPWRRLEEVARWEWNADLASSLDFEALVLRKHRHATLTVYMGSALGKFMVLDLPVDLRSDDEARAAAQAQMQHQLGLQPEQWTFSVDRLPGGNQAVACALRADVFVRIGHLARTRGLRLVSLRPFAASSWNALQAPHQTPAATGEDAQALMLVEKDAFAIVIEKAGAIVSVNALSHRREAALIDREIRRMAYALGEDAQRHIRLALIPELLPLAQLHTDKLLQHEAYLRQPIYSDFRDLLFQPLPQVAT